MPPKDKGVVKDIERQTEDSFNCPDLAELVYNESQDIYVRDCCYTCPLRIDPFPG